MRQWCFAICLGLSACAGSGLRARAPESGESVARRLYAVGEQRFAEGRADQAVALWRHAITQLPQTAQYDELRHKLVLRLGYGQLVAYETTGKLAHLYDGARMLERYLAKHESLFGGRGHAKAERDQVYDLLGEIEIRIAKPPRPAGLADAAPVVADASEPPPFDPFLRGIPSRPKTLDTSVAEDPQPTPMAQRKAWEAAHPDRAWGRPREDDRGLERVVIVDRRKLAQPDIHDPVVREALRRWDPFAGAILTAPSIAQVHGPRALVRIGGLARRTDGQGERLAAHGLAAAAIRSARPALRACYDAAFARNPSFVATTEVSFTVQADGTIAQPRIVEGTTGDSFGDICVLERLAAVKLPAIEGGEATPVSIPLTFFYEGARYLNEANGAQGANTYHLQYAGGMPSASDGTADGGPGGGRSRRFRSRQF